MKWFLLVAIGLVFIALLFGLFQLNLFLLGTATTPIGFVAATLWAIGSNMVLGYSTGTLIGWVWYDL